MDPIVLVAISAFHWLSLEKRSNWAEHTLGWQWDHWTRHWTAVLSRQAHRPCRFRTPLGPSVRSHRLNYNSQDGEGCVCISSNPRFAGEIALSSNRFSLPALVVRGSLFVRIVRRVVSIASFGSVGVRLVGSARWRTVSPRRASPSIWCPYLWSDRVGANPMDAVVWFLGLTSKHSGELPSFVNHQADRREGHWHRESDCVEWVWPMDTRGWSMTVGMNFTYFHFTFLGQWARMQIGSELLCHTIHG